MSDLLERARLAAILLFLSLPVHADYYLITVHLDSEARTIERFISLSDCRKRGSKNIDLAALVGVRFGFMCVEVKEERKVRI